MIIVCFCTWEVVSAKVASGLGLSTLQVDSGWKLVLESNWGGRVGVSDRDLGCFCLF